MSFFYVITCSANKPLCFIQIALVFEPTWAHNKRPISSSYIGGKPIVSVQCYAMLKISRRTSVIQQKTVTMQVSQGRQKPKTTVSPSSFSLTLSCVCLFPCFPLSFCLSLLHSMQAHRTLQGVEGQAGSPAAALPLWVRQGGQRASGLSPTTLQHYQARAKHSARGIAWWYTSLIFSMYA